MKSERNKKGVFFLRSIFYFANSVFTCVSVSVGEIADQIDRYHFLVCHQPSPVLSSSSLLVEIYTLHAQKAMPSRSS